MAFQNQTISMHYVRSIIKAAVLQGHDDTPLLVASGINPDILDSSDMRVTPEQFACLMQECWAVEDDEWMGMAASQCRHGLFSLMAKQAVHCRTLRDVYRHLCRFYNLTSTALELTFSADDTEARVKMTLANPERDENYMLADFLMMLWHRFPAWLIGRQIQLYRVDFEFDKPGHAAEYRLLFPCPIYFNQAENQFSFPAEYLSHPVVQTPGTLKTHLRHAPLDWVKRQNYYQTYTRSVLDALTTNDGFVDQQIEDIADTLNVTSRTLRRKLIEESTSFNELKHITRRDTAIHLLSNRKLSIGQIAERLGYSDAAPFSRAFKKWTGFEPSRYRNR